MFDSPFTADMTLPIVLVAVLVITIVVLVLVIWSIKRHRDPHLRIECDAPLSELVPSLAGLTHSAVIEGNSVEVYENGAFFEMMFDEIAAAKQSVHFETFLWKEGVLGQRLADALVARSRAGLQVRVIVDADGGKKMGEAAERRLVEGGCKFLLYRKKRLRDLGKLNRRDHRKLVVIDGKVGLVCGHCIVDSWLGNAEDSEHVRDVGVRIRGPVVHALQSAFCENWIDETGELFVGDEVFPPLDKAGDVAVHVARIKPEGSIPAVKVLHHLLLCVARERLWIQNPYFLPNMDAIEAFGQAVARGVDVRVMVPSAGASDFPIVQHAAHRNFEPLLASGVRIFEYPKTLLHQKVMTVDGVWCAVGSSNFDDRSFEINDEITLGLLDGPLAKQFEEIFERDAQDCVELKHEAWAGRGLWHKLQDNACYLFKEQL